MLNIQLKKHTLEQKVELTPKSPSLFSYSKHVLFMSYNTKMQG